MKKTDQRAPATRWPLVLLLIVLLIGLAGGLTGCGGGDISDDITADIPTTFIGPPDCVNHPELCQ